MIEKNRKYLMFFLGIFLFQTAMFFGQEQKNKVKSKQQIIKEYTKKAIDFGYEKKFDSANYYIQKSLKLVEGLNDKDLKSHVIYYHAKIEYWQANIEKAKILLYQNQSNNVSDSSKVASHLLYGEIYSYEKKYKQALNNFIKSEEILIKQTNLSKKDSNRIYSCYGNIGRIHHELKNLDKAKKYYSKALLFAPNANRKSYLLFEISTLYDEDKKLSKAIEYAKDAVKMASENNIQLMLPTYCAGLSQYYIQAGNSNKAIYYANMGLQKNTYCRLNWLNEAMGDAFLLKKEYLKAIDYFEIALKYTTPDETLEIYKKLTKIYRDKKNYELAFNYNDKFTKLKDSIDNLKIKQEIVAITEKFESDKKEIKIKSLNEKNQLSNLIIKKQTSQIILFALLLVLSLIVLGLIYSFYKKQKKQKHLLYLKNRELAKKIASNKVENKKTNSCLTVEIANKDEIESAINGFIKENFFLDNEMTLTKMAKELNTNTSYLSKIINEDFNKTFTNFINDLRIDYILKKVETLPEYRKLTIEDIGDKAGFSSSNAFYRAFKKYTGLTPSYYIKKIIEHD